MTERPDLYAAVISEVGMLNAVRFENMPGGLNHAKEFGYITDSTECKGLIEMDAYLHIDNSVKYPPFLAVVGMNDLRVSPWQSGKFVAKLQENNWSENTALMMVDFNEGHYFNSTKTKSMEKLASVFSFAFWQPDQDNVNQTITKSTGHFIYIKEPELVIAAIENVVNRIEKTNNDIK
jgi:prolyl oligopeptidase